MKGLLLQIIHRNANCHILLLKFQIISNFNISPIYTSSQWYIIAEGRLKIQQVAVKVKKKSRGQSTSDNFQLESWVWGQLPTTIKLAA